MNLIRYNMVTFSHFLFTKKVFIKDAQYINVKLFNKNCLCPYKVFFILFLAHLRLNLSCMVLEKDFSITSRKTSLILDGQGTN